MTPHGYDNTLVTLKQSVERLKKREIDMSELDESSELGDQLGLDSLDLLELRFDIEEAWSIRLEDHEAAQLRTVGDVVDLIHYKLNLVPTAT